MDDVNDADSDPTNEIETWSTLGGIPSGFSDDIDNVNDADNDPTNEIETWSTLAGIPSGFSDDVDNVDDADSDPNNEIQALSINQDTIFLSNGGFVLIPQTFLKDMDGDTKIEVEKNADEDTIRFTVNGAEIGEMSDSTFALTGFMGIGHDNPEVDLDIRSDTNKVIVNLIPKNLSTFGGSARSEINMRTNEDSQEGYSIESTADFVISGFPPSTDTLRLLLFKHIDENGIKSTKLTIAKNYVSVRPETELYVNDKSYFREDLSMNNINSDTTSLLFEGSSANASISSSPQGMHIVNEENTPLNFWTNDQNHMTLDNTGRLGLGTESPGATLDVRGDAVFNEDGQDVDLRIEGTNYNSLFFVDASTNNVGIRTISPEKTLTVIGDALFSDTVSFLDPPVIQGQSGNDAELYMETDTGGLGRVILKENGSDLVIIGDVDPRGGRSHT